MSEAIKLFAVWRPSTDEYWDIVWGCWSGFSPNVLLTEEGIARGIARECEALLKFFDLTETRITNPKYFLTEVDRRMTPGYNTSRDGRLSGEE